MKTKLIKILFLLTAASFSSALQGWTEEKSSALPPHTVDGGVEFQFYAPDAQMVYLAGDFNGWAENDQGKVTNRDFAMTKGDKGIWKKVVRVDPGKHAFKFVVDGKDWFPDPHILEKDHDSNSIFTVLEGGKVYMAERNPAYAPRKVKGGVLFQFLNPQAKVVYLAGSFNEWGKNDNGLVSDSKFLMEGPDKKGLWKKVIPISAGKYSFQYVLDGDKWFPDPNLDEKDTDGNSVVEIQ